MKKNHSSSTYFGHVLYKHREHTIQTERDGEREKSRDGFGRKSMRGVIVRKRRDSRK